MRLAIVVRSITISNGIYKAVCTYLRSRPSERVQVELVTFGKPEQSCRQELEALNIPIHVLDDDSFFLSCYQLRRILRNHKVDVVVGTTWKTYIIAKLASIGARTKSAVWLHSIHHVIEGMPRTVLFRLFSRHDPMIFTSGAVQDKHQFSWHKGEQYIVHNGVETPSDLYSRSMLAQIGVPQDACVLGYTAAFTKLKNHGTLLKAFDNLVAERSNLHLVLIGVGETFDSVVEMVRYRNLSHQVHFLRGRSDAKQMLGTFDIYVHPCDGEGFGLALAEAMAAGLPVVAANAGAVPEIIRNGEDGLLFSPLDSEELARSLNRLIEDQELRTFLGSNARRTICERFSADVFSKSLTVVFDSIIQDGARSPQRLSRTVEEN